MIFRRLHSIVEPVCDLVVSEVVLFKEKFQYTYLFFIKSIVFLSCFLTNQSIDRFLKVIIGEQSIRGYFI